MTSWPVCYHGKPLLKPPRNQDKVGLREWKSPVRSQHECVHSACKSHSSSTSSPCTWSYGEIWPQNKRAGSRWPFTRVVFYQSWCFYHQASSVTFMEHTSPTIAFIIIHIDQMDIINQHLFVIYSIYIQRLQVKVMDAWWREWSGWQLEGGGGRCRQQSVSKNTTIHSEV